MGIFNLLILKLKTMNLFVIYLIGIIIALIMMRAGRFGKQTQAAVQIRAMRSDIPEQAMTIAFLLLSLFSWINVIVCIWSYLCIFQLMHEKNLTWKQAVDKHTLGWFIDEITKDKK